MQRALGPFLATGVALVAATVVVANPVAPQSRDMRISTTQLSTSPDLLSPSDKSLLSALAPPPPISDLGPALAQILAALAADADRISREVDSSTIAEPPAGGALAEQTAYRPDPVAATFVESPNAAAAVASAGFAASVAGSQVVQVLNGLVADGSFLGGKVVEAAYAVVDVIIRVPEFVITAALDLLNGDFAGVVDTVKSVIQAFFGPGLIILDGIRDVLYGRQLPAVAPPAAILKSLTGQSSNSTADDATATSTPAATPTPAATGQSGRARTQTLSPAVAALRPTTTASKSAASSDTDANTTPAKTTSTSKPAGSTRSTAGSARNAKSGSGSSSSSN